MNKILKLLDETFVLDYLRRELAPLYPGYQPVSRVEIKPYKKLVWETTYHAVIGYNVYFPEADGREKKISVVCSAHSDEPRRNVYDALHYLWSQDFNGRGVDLPRPLFYSEEFNGTFYRAIKGENLLFYIKKKDYAAVEGIIIAAAGLFARLHALPAGKDADFNPINSRIRTVIPGTEMIFSEMTARYGDKYCPDLRKIYDYFIRQEEKFFSSGAELKLIHGDAHPENIIKTAEDRIGIIDFTDLCLSDPARDLGTFLQQLDYKITGKAGDREWAGKIKKLFLDKYLAASGRKLDADLQARIDLYYNWTAIRTSVFWFLRFEHNEERAGELLDMVKKNLNIS